MRIIFILLLISLQWSCQRSEKADLLVFNAHIYSVDSSFSVTEAMVIRDGKIVALGKTGDLESRYEAKEKLDAGGKFIYPGFIDAHAHFLSYGFNLNQVDLVGTGSWAEIVQKVKTFAGENPQGWIEGFGWDQNDWPGKQYPSNEELNKLFPDRPVLLSRIDGHAAIANDAALKLANVKAGQSINGGEVVVKNGSLTGLLVDNAVGLVANVIPPPSASQVKEALLDAQKKCFATGLTTVDDCGLDASSVMLIDSLQKKGELKMRIYALLSDAKNNYDFALARGKIKTDRLNVSGFKVYADGALGSRGACLLQPYSDRAGWSGFLLNTISHYDSVAAFLYDHNWQMCTHAIGDSGNRMILGVYARQLKGKNDRRWRIEHAQVINQSDFSLFGQYSIIPSVQPTHATSDMYWAGDRLGPIRIKGAYAYRQLLDQNGWLPLGTDFPVEDISPFRTFYAAVIRKDMKGWPPEGFQTENSLSREQAIRGITIWAAKANFEETEKGSLETGKLADFIILDEDLMKAPAEKLFSIKVLKTYINGEKVFEEK